MKKYPPAKKKNKISQASNIDMSPNINITHKPVVSYYVIVIIIAACFLFYGNTLRLQYAYDDLMVITGNQFTKEGFSGIGDILTTDFFTGYFGRDQNMVSGGRYRPLSLVTFALEYQAFGENPFVGHLMNVILFTITCILVLILTAKLSLIRLQGPTKVPWFVSAPLLITLLFAAHPVHTEVVANIKSRDEILALLFCLLCLLFSLKFLEQKKPILLIAGGASYFLALLSKENALTFLLVQPLVVWFFTRRTIRSNFIALLPLVAASIIFLVIRQSVTGHTANPLENDLMNNPFIEMTLAQKYATILYTLGIYLKLLIFPHPLTADYYPYHIPIIDPADWRAIGPLIIYLLMIAYIIIKFRRRDLAAFCFLYYLITLSIVSNLFFPIGAFMNERFLFMPSLGFCILAGAGLASLPKRVISNNGSRYALIAVIMIVILSLFAHKTITRNADWYDSYTLFTTDVKVSRNSAKANEVAGEYLMQRATGIKEKPARDSLLRQSIAYQRKAISIYPKQIIALINLAAAYYEYNQDYDSILAIYKTILRYLPGNTQIYTYFNTLMARYDSIDHKITLYTDLLKLDPERFNENMNLGLLYLGGKQDAASALPYLEKAAAINPRDFDGQKFLGTAYGYLGRWEEARACMERAESIKPGDAELNKYLGIVYQNLGLRAKDRQAPSKTQ